MLFLQLATQHPLPTVDISNSGSCCLPNPWLTPQPLQFCSSLLGFLNSLLFCFLTSVLFPHLTLYISVGVWISNILHGPTYCELDSHLMTPFGEIMELNIEFGEGSISARIGMKVYHLVPLPVFSLSFLWLDEDVISQLSSSATSHYSSPDIIDYLSGTIYSNKLSLPQIILVMVFYHNKKQPLNIIVSQSALFNSLTFLWI